MFAFIEDGKINGCGEYQQLTAGVTNIEIPEDVYNNINRYKWNGEKIIENPNYEEEEKARYNEKMRLSREQAYMSESDCLVARRIRKQTINDWTAEDEAEFVQKMHELTVRIKERYPYAE